MLSLLRGSSARAFSPVLRRGILTNTKVVRPTPYILLQFQTRFVASSVSGKPASQSLEHAATNIKEEAGNSAADLAKMIASTNMMEANISKEEAKSFAGITASVARNVPKPAMVLGLAGGLPYLGASISTVYLAHQAGMATAGMGMDPGVATTLLDQALTFQVTYGAVMLSFLGAIHWGMEFASLGGRKGYSRLLLGAAPLFVAWPTLALLQPTSALIAQWVAFTGLWYVESKVTLAGWAPSWYSQYRFYLSILVGTCIIGSLAGTSYWGPVAGHGLLSHDVENLRQLRREHMPERHGLIAGPVSAVSTGEQGDHFIAIKKTEPKHEEEEKASEGEKKQESGKEQ